MIAICIIAAVGIGQLMDWAFFERLTTILCGFGQVGDENLYRNTLFPRVVVTVPSSIVIMIGMQSEPPNSTLLIAEASVFILSSVYGVFVALNGVGQG
jgi:hypothetical protein